MNFAHCLQIVLAIGKYTEIIQGGFFLVGWFGVGDYVEDLSMEEFFMGREFFMKGRRISQQYLKNDQKLNRKTSFFN